MVKNLIDESKKKVINGWRGIAVLLILFTHVLAVKIIQKTNFHWILDQGWIGVNLFFILSGMVLYLPYASGNRKIDSVKDAVDFYIRRFRRLYPLFFFVLTISLLFFGQVDRPRLISYFMSLGTFTSFTNYDFFPTLNSVFWSLAIEIQFSLLFPAIIYLVTRYSLWKVSIGIFVLSFSIRWIGADYHHHFFHINPIKDIVFARLDDFIVGMILAWFITNKPPVKKVNAMWILPFILVLISATILCDLIQNNSISTIYFIFINNLLQVGFGALILLSFYNKTVSAILLLNNKPVRILGIMCYSIYSWHVLLLETKPEFGLFYDIFDLFIYSSFLLILSTFTFLYIEFPEKKLTEIFDS